MGLLLALKSVCVCEWLALVIAVHMSMVGKLFTGTPAPCQWSRYWRKWLLVSQQPLTAASSLGKGKASLSFPLFMMKCWQVQSCAGNHSHGELMSVNSHVMPKMSFWSTNSHPPALTLFPSCGDFPFLLGCLNTVKGFMTLSKDV